ncbi:MAG: nucleoside-diphosphate-sugar epimerase, partial [Candidatus Sulfotelmatobacter sp.]|nr:nucleoside-diphosphate-sugar epimerase [Candidatus Sulfotelmatobacter sp.]
MICTGENTLGTKVRSLVTGAGGFIGNHLVSHLRAQGYWVRGVDLKPPEFCASDANEFELLDLRRWEDCLRATSDVDEVYALAAGSGEMGSSSADQSRISHDNYLINLHCIEAARHNHVTRYLYASSTAIYSPYQHSSPDDVPHEEASDYPLIHQDAYRWANLMIEPLCIRYRRDYGLETRIVRVDDVFGPVGSWYDGREKAPTALCRKIAAAQLEGLHEIEVSGAGEQTGSFCYIDDCVAGL